MRTPAQRALRVAVLLSSTAGDMELVVIAGRRTHSGYNIRDTMPGMFTRASKKKATWSIEGIVDVKILTRLVDYPTNGLLRVYIKTLVCGGT